MNICEYVSNFIHILHYKILVCRKLDLSDKAVSYCVIILILVIYCVNNKELYLLSQIAPLIIMLTGYLWYRVAWVQPGWGSRPAGAARAARAT